MVIQKAQINYRQSLIENRQCLFPNRPTWLQKFSAVLPRYNALQLVGHHLGYRNYLDHPLKCNAWSTPVPYELMYRK